MKTIVLLSAALVAATASAAVAQTRRPPPPSAGPFAIPPTFEINQALTPPRACPEGRTSDGQCVNPIAGQMARRTAILATQAKISTSAGPVAAPTYDPYYRYPNALYADTKRDIDLQLGRRSSSYVPQPYHPFGGPGTPYPFTYPVR